MKLRCTGKYFNTCKAEITQMNLLSPRNEVWAEEHRTLHYKKDYILQK